MSKTPEEERDEFLSIFGLRANQFPAEISYEEQKYWEAFMKSDYPYYVTMFDRFLSGWGGASNRKALYVYGARSFKEADIVASNAIARGDQSNVNIHTGKPRVRDPTKYRFQFVDPANKDYTRWYKEAGWGHGGEYGYG